MPLFSTFLDIPLGKTLVTKESHCTANGPVTYLCLNDKHIASKHLRLNVVQQTVAQHLQHFQMQNCNRKFVHTCQKSTKCQGKGLGNKQQANHPSPNTVKQATYHQNWGETFVGKASWPCNCTHRDKLGLDQAAFRSKHDPLVHHSTRKHTCFNNATSPTKKPSSAHSAIQSPMITSLNFSFVISDKEMVNF